MNPDHKFAIATAPRRNSRHWKLGEVTWADIVGWCTDPAKRKESGNYLLGSLRPDTTVLHAKGEDPCTNVHRRKDFVVSRSAITLDVDDPPADFLTAFELTFPYAALAHTTYSSSPDAPRYRVIIPIDRDLAPDEYVAAAQAAMSMLGGVGFDPGSTQPERYMFKPAAQDPTWFDYRVLEGDLVAASNLLNDFDRDLSSTPMPKPHRNKRNPFELDGVVGAFNRAYAEWDDLIEAYELPYTKVATDRYQLVGSAAVAGMGPVAGTEGFVYSHHANDPAYGKTCSAFDLVRLHRFGELDEGTSEQTPINKLPSTEAMLDLVATDHRVVAELVGVDFSADMGDDAADNDWKIGLRLAPRSGKMLDVIGNWDLIRDNDPVFSGLYYNVLTMAIETDVDLPWRKVYEQGPLFSKIDRSHLRHHLERNYGLRPSRELVEELVETKAQARWINPIIEYLESLTWDGKPRLERALPGVEDNAYNRMVSRRSLVAAVARMYEPGIKWDHTLVLYGSQGLGKSWWVNKMALGTYSANLGPINSKDTLLTMHRSWIMTADEGQSMRKADHDALKEFLTRTHDVFRAPYDKETLAHGRRCVIWSTTNDETFLRRQEGNRRFLIVHCVDKVDFDKEFLPDHVDQIWAEAVYTYKAGEPLFLNAEESALADFERERYIEEDALAGIIEQYLDTTFPDDWHLRDVESRRTWLFGGGSEFDQGSTKIREVCTMQIWVEALGRNKGDHRRTDLIEISEALRRLGWTPRPGKFRLFPYGSQVVFDPPKAKRKHRPGSVLDDLI